MKAIVSTLHLIRSAASTFQTSRSRESSRIGHVARKSSVALLALLAVGAMFSTASTASAANIRLKVSVAGYGEVRLLPGSNTGGRVVMHQGGYFYTDRVARGELLSIESHPDDNVGECVGTPAVVGYDKKGDEGLKYFVFKEGRLMLRHTVRIPQDPGFSNMMAWTYSDAPASYNEVRIPIGSR